LVFALLVVHFKGITLKPFLSLVSSYVSRGSLEDVLVRRQLAIGAKRLLHFAADAARGLEHMHARGLLHHDIAARNLLLDDDWTVKVCDLGMARARGEKTSDLFAVKWVAPEGLLHQQFSEKSDVWSWATAIWEVFARKAPFEKLQNFQVALKVAHKGERLPIPRTNTSPAHTHAHDRDCRVGRS
jgi:serine/threonine protein kinase